MKLHLRNAILFLSAFIVFEIVAGFFILQFSKSEGFYMLHQNHSLLFDFLFKAASDLGETTCWVLAIIGASLYRIKYGVAALLSLIIGLVVVQTLKHFVFLEAMRPSAYLVDGQNLSIVPVHGVKLHAIHSFPSGHTASAFSAFLCLAFCVEKRFLGLLFLVMAVLTGYSRIYLGQHFPIDVWAGALLGVCFSIIAFALSDWYFSTRLHNWADRHLLSLFSRVD